MRKVSKRKNVSQKIKNGTVILTRDEFFEDNNGYRKPEYEDKPNVLYREGAVVDSNRQGHLGIIKFHSGGKLFVNNNAGQRENYNPFIKTKDHRGNPIVLGENFKRANPKYDVSAKKANQMKRQAIQHPNKKVARANRQALQALKGRKK